MKKPTMNRKKEAIARPNMWKRKGMHKRVVYLKKKDKQGRVYTKTPGGLRYEDLMMNKKGRVVSKKQHARGAAVWSTFLKPFFEARRTVISQYSASKFLKANSNGTEAERRLFVAMAMAKKEYHERCVKEAARVLKNMPDAAVPPVNDSAAGAVTGNTVGDDVPFFPNGSNVVLHGLEALEFNGVTGKIVSWDVSQQRYGVEMGSDFKAIKPCNLRLVV